MDIFLTKEELQREENLFKAHNESCPPLEGRKCSIKDFVPPETDDPDRPKPPPSC